MTVVPFRTDEDVTAALTRVVAHLSAGGLIAYPTETVYGLGSRARGPEVQAVARLKGRRPGKPFLLLVADRDMAEAQGLALNESASALARAFWPGPLTLVLPGGSGRLPDVLRGPEGGIAVRWTPHRGLSRLVQAYGAPITSTSANRPGVVPATNAGQILEQWADAISRGTLHVLDGGQLLSSPPSTVVDCTGPRPRVIRPGAITVATLRASVPDIVGDSE